MRVRFVYPLLALLVLLLPIAFFLGRKTAPAPASAQPTAIAQNSSTASTTQTFTPSSSSAPTNIYAHNLLLRKGPTFGIYVRWLQGQITPTRHNVIPSFDDPNSFYLNIKTGVLRANMGDIQNLLNTNLGKAPLQNLKLSGDNDQIKLTGTVHKLLLPLPVEITATISALPDGRIQLHVTKIDVLRVPLKGLLGDFHLNVADLFHPPQGLQGLQISGNDIFIDPHTLLPPPHILGQLKKVHVVNPDLEEVYGDAEADVTRTEQWRNFLRLSNGSIDFGKLTMNNVDLMMIDISQDSWFDLDLANYQKQLVNGYTRMTPQAGLQIFMPDLRQIPNNQDNQNISIQWLKNRNIPPPASVLSSKPKL